MWLQVVYGTWISPADVVKYLHVAFVQREATWVYDVSLQV
jgi:hypothetical protein